MSDWRYFLVKNDAMVFCPGGGAFPWRRGPAHTWEGLYSARTLA
jgi:hypothetical protein